MEKRDLFLFISMGIIIFVLIGFIIISQRNLTSNVSLNTPSEDSSNTSEKLPESYAKSDVIQIEKIDINGETLNLTYKFDNSQFIGGSIGIDIWITNNSDAELNRIRDEFSINKDGLIERNLLIELPSDLTDEGYLYLAPSSDLTDFVKQPIYIKENSITGNIILNFGDVNLDNKKIFFFLSFIFIIGIFFIILHNRKMKEGKIESKNEWLLKKKTFFDVRN